MNLREALITQSPSLALQRAAADEISRLDGEVLRLQESIPIWVPVTERLPNVGVVVLVRAPATPDDWTDEDRISFDFISEDWEDWNNHCESYEHYMAIGGSNACGPDTVCAGPSEKAPYTHWVEIRPPSDKPDHKG